MNAKEKQKVKKLYLLSASHYDRLFTQKKNKYLIREGIEKEFFNILTSKQYNTEEKLIKIREMLTQINNEKLNITRETEKKVEEKIRPAILSSTPIRRSSPVALKRKSLSFQDIQKTPQKFVDNAGARVDLEEIFEHNNPPINNAEEERANLSEESEPDLSAEKLEFLQNIREALGEEDVDFRRLSQANLSREDEANVLIETEDGGQVVVPKPKAFLRKLGKVEKRKNVRTSAMTEMKRLKPFLTSPRRRRITPMEKIKSGMPDGWTKYEKIRVLRSGASIKDRDLK